MFLTNHCPKSLIVALLFSVTYGAQAQVPALGNTPARPTTSNEGTEVSAVGASDEAATTPEAAAPAAAPTIDDANVAEARRRFDRGLRLYNDGDFTLALIEFERAYELVANYRVLYNIGQVSIQLRRYAKAREALEQYLAQSGAEIDATRLAEVQADIDMLKPRTAKLLVTSDAPKAKVLLDGELLGTLPLSGAVLVDAGNHLVKVDAPGYQSSERSVVLAGGDDITVAVALEVIRPARTVEKQTIVVHDVANTDNTWKWVGWGTTGVLAAGAITTGIFGLNSASKLEDLVNTAGVSHEELSSEQSRAKRMFLASDILAASAVAAAAVSLYLTISGSSDENPDPAGKVAVTLTPGALSVRSVF